MPISIVDYDEDERGDDLPLKEALAWIATRNPSFVYALSEEWDLDLHRMADGHGVEMKFAKNGSEAWALLRDAICGNRIQAVGVLGAISDFPHGNRTKLTADVAGHLELVVGSSLTLVARNLSANPEQWSRVRLNLAGLQREYPELGSSAKTELVRGSKRSYAVQLLQKHFPNGPEGREKKEVVAFIMKAIQAGRRPNERLPSAKTVERAIDKWKSNLSK
jgi:hypothetical protein